MALGRVFLRRFLFSLVSIFPTMLHISLHLHTALTRRVKEEVWQYSKKHWSKKSGKHWIQKYYHVMKLVHSCQQKSIGLKFSKSQTGSDVRYISHHNSSRFTFPIFAHSCRFSVLHSLQSITPRIY